MTVHTFTRFVFALSLLLPAMLSSAQEDVRPEHRCGTVQYNQWLCRQDPTIAARQSMLREKISHYLEAAKPETKTLITIPVIVHVLWNTPEQNIPDYQVWSQLDALNEDFRRRNYDTLYTPDIFKAVAADCQIEFCLAKRTADSLPSTGIVRMYTPVTSFLMDNGMKSAYTGGSPAWDADKFFNIWVCNMEGNVLGYAQFPGGPDSTDGIVIHYRNFGRLGNLNQHYNLGRTATHETGHWLDLYHIWGDDFGSCAGTDYIDDTPNAADANYYCPTHPRTTSCNSEGEMFMNYMDYVDDHCFNLFTYGQSERMHAALYVIKPDLMASDGCNPVIGLEEYLQGPEAEIFPNPSDGLLTLVVSTPSADPLSIWIFNEMGQAVMKDCLRGSFQYQYPLDLSQYGDGLYYLMIYQGKRLWKGKIIILP